MVSKSLHELAVVDGSVKLDSTAPMPKIVSEVSSEIDRHELRESRGDGRGHFEFFAESQFEINDSVQRDDAACHSEIIDNVELKLREEVIALKEAGNVKEDAKSNNEKKIENVQKTLDEISALKKELVALTDHSARATKMLDFLKSIDKKIQKIMGSSVDQLVAKMKPVEITLLKLAGNKFGEIFTINARKRLAYFGYTSTRENPYAEIVWGKDKPSLNIIFSEPKKVGEEAKIKLPRKLGLRYSNLNPVRKTVENWIRENYQPSNRRVNELQRVRFEQSKCDFVQDGIRWIKNNNKPEIQAIDEDGTVTGTKGTVIGSGKILRTGGTEKSSTINSSLFTWFTESPGLTNIPKNPMIRACSNVIVKVAEQPINCA
jgi:hypothetical protein